MNSKMKLLKLLITSNIGFCVESWFCQQLCVILEIHLTSLSFRFHKCTIRWKCSKNYHTNEHLKTLHRLFSTELELKYGKVKVKSLSHVQLFATPWTVAFQAPLSMGFSRQEHWSGLPFPSAGDLPHPGIKPSSSATQADSLLSEPPGRYGEAALPQWISWFPKYWDSCTCQQTDFPIHLIRLLGTQVPNFWREKAERKEKCFNSSIGVVSQIAIKNWNISCHISKQGYHSHQQFPPPNVNSWALRALRKEKNTCDLVAIRLEPLGTMSPEELRMWKTQGSDHKIAKMHERDGAQALPFSHMQKSAEFLNLGYLVFFNSQ